MPSKKGKKEKQTVGYATVDEAIKHIEENAPEPEDTGDDKQLSDPTPEEPKPNKKLEALVGQLADKKGRLNKYLKQQGLGQNAIKKVFELVNEINVVKNLIAFEEKWSE